MFSVASATFFETRHVGFDSKIHNQFENVDYKSFDRLSSDFAATPSTTLWFSDFSLRI